MALTEATEVREYRVWTETSDLVYVGDDRAEAELAMAEAIMDHIAYAECGGCGVLTPANEHGYSLQICDGEWDVTAHEI